MPKKRRGAIIRRLPGAMQAQLAAGELPWWLTGRPEQLSPGHDDWRWWLIGGGRGGGKTRSGAERCKAWSLGYPEMRGALVAPTFADGRDTMVEGESGLLSVLPPSMLRGGRVDTAWNRSLGELFLANGSQWKVYSSEKPRSLRGPQFHFAWGDEPSYWRDAHRGTSQDSTWSNLNFALRLRARPGWPDYQPQAVLTFTPRRCALLKVPDEVARAQPHHAGLLQRVGRPGYAMTTMPTRDNLHNLSATYLEAVIEPLIGTTLGRQELDAILLEDVEGALWRQAMIDAGRDHGVDLASVHRRVVSFDPAGAEDGTGDEHGIVVVGDDRAGQVYVLDDLSGHMSPLDAAKTALRAAILWQAGEVVYERNQGQGWIRPVFKTAWDQLVNDGEASGVMPRLASVHASVGKRLRAEPVVALYETHRVHHTRPLPALEGQMTTWVPGDGESPDRLDALVHGVTYLAGVGMASIQSAVGTKRAAVPASGSTLTARRIDR